MSDVSGNRPPPQDRLPKHRAESKPVGLARVTYISETSAVCSCGWAGSARARPKVVEDMIDRHLVKKHNGRGIRL